mmetsp:Transcript_8250/g.13357  ORF Transcript_8250/g.13357 Transcript_8250/m.13357 type:complete len:101 (+) Transcript_8250:930-1232(+)
MHPGIPHGENQKCVLHDQEHKTEPFEFYGIPQQRNRIIVHHSVSPGPTCPSSPKCVKILPVLPNNPPMFPGKSVTTLMTRVRLKQHQMLLATCVVVFCSH